MEHRASAWALGGSAALAAAVCCALRRPRPLRVAELWIFPVKSCGGLRVREATMAREGLLHDREFAIAEAESGKVLSQKTQPKLAVIVPELTMHGGELRSLSLTSALDPADRVEVDLTRGGPELRTTWAGNSEPLQAQHLAAADAWLQRQLGCACRLVRLSSRRTLRTTRLAAVARDSADSCRLHDGAPLTILSRASVEGLNRMLGARVASLRYRANVVVEGCGPLAETRWRSLRIGGTAEGRGGAGVRLLMDAYRCVMVNIAQPGEVEAAAGTIPGTKPQGGDVLRALRALASSTETTHGPLPRDSPNFAIFAVPDQDRAVVREGDVVYVRGGLDASWPSLFRYNEARHPERFRFLDSRFWESLGARR